MTRFVKNLRLAVLLATFILTMSLVACSDANYPKPDTTVTSFFDALSKGDFKTAQSYCASSSSDPFKFEDANEEKVVKLMFSKTKCEIISSQVEGDSATVKTKITNINLAKVMETMASDMISKATDAALNGEDTSNQNAEEMAMKYLEESMTKADAPVTTNEVDIKLIKDKKKKAWAIQDDDAFAKAITGNIDEMLSGTK